MQLMVINASSIQNGKLISILAVRSPINRIVSSVIVKMGSYGNVSSAVAEIVDNSQL